MIATLLKSFEKLQIQGSVVSKDKFDVHSLSTPAVKYNRHNRIIIHAARRLAFDSWHSIRKV